jgi:hypothetical protein
MLQAVLGSAVDLPRVFPEVPMSYSDFTLDTAESILGLSSQFVDLFPKIEPVTPPQWLVESLVRGQRHVMVGEKARSEFLVVPVLMASEEICEGAVSLYSGQRLDVSPERGLIGECDFILAAGPAVPKLQAPLITVVEAKKSDIESGLGQCVAQMAAAQLFNLRHDQLDSVVFGCVTTGELWQFLRLERDQVGIDRTKRFIGNVGEILAVLNTIIGRGGK